MTRFTVAAVRHNARVSGNFVGGHEGLKAACEYADELAAEHQGTTYAVRDVVTLREVYSVYVVKA